MASRLKIEMSSGARRGFWGGGGERELCRPVLASLSVLCSTGLIASPQGADSWSRWLDGPRMVHQTGLEQLSVSAPGHRLD